MKTVRILLIASLLLFLSMEVLSEAEESFTEKYALSSKGYDFEKVLERVSLIFELDKDYITGKGNQADRVKARDLLCYWCNNKLGWWSHIYD